MDFVVERNSLIRYLGDMVGEDSVKKIVNALEVFRDRESNQLHFSGFGLVERGKSVRSAIYAPFCDMGKVHYLVDTSLEGDVLKKEEGIQRKRLWIPDSRCPKDFFEEYDAFVEEARKNVVAEIESRVLYHEVMIPNGCSGEYLRAILEARIGGAVGDIKLLHTINRTDVGTRRLFAKKQAYVQGADIAVGLFRETWDSDPFFSPNMVAVWNKKS